MFPSIPTGSRLWEFGVRVLVGGERLRQTLQQAKTALLATDVRSVIDGFLNLLMVGGGLCFWFLMAVLISFRFFMWLALVLR